MQSSKVHWASLWPIFWTLHLLDCLTPLFLDLCFILSYGFCFFVFSSWVPFCVCFYVISEAPKSPSLVSVALCSRCPAAQSWERFSCRPSLSPASAPPGPLAKIQQAIHRCCACSCLKRPRQKPRSTATSVSLGTAQHGGQDSLRTQLDVAWVEPQVGGGGVSGSPLGKITCYPVWWCLGHGGT